MNKVLTIAGGELALWRRTRVAVLAVSAFAIVLVVSCLLTAQRMSHAAEERTRQQTTAEETFRSQPERHPHRMVHYGHYAFRSPPPLAIVDPGVDATTGQSIFLEGHRQNTAMFSDARASADLGGLGSLTPARVYQFLLPLLLIALGHAVMVREREARTLGSLLAQGVTGRELYAGKSAALLGVSAVMLVPVLLLSAYGMLRGESLAASLGLFGLYAAYAVVWCSAVVLVSTLAKARSVALGVLTSAWLASTLVIPPLAVATTDVAVPSVGKTQSDLRMQAELRELGDGHNASDPAFAKLRDNLLAQYDVEDVADLPINFRGVVAQNSEASLTELMNRYAEERMALELRQCRRAAVFGWLSPTMAVSNASRAVAGTDLETHHRFLRETEALRFDFVQGLNKVHAEQLAYSDDINRSRDADAERRTRVSTENWEVLASFRFEPDPTDVRWGRASADALPLLAWLGVFTGLGVTSSGRVRP
ncbi:MAG: DUF3526 domain-containing protein [Acidobacteriota bacterium]